MAEQNEPHDESFIGTITKLCKSFVNLSYKEFQSARRKEEDAKASTRLLFQNTFDQIIFGYDDHFNSSDAESKVSQTISKCKTSLGKEQTELLRSLISSRDDEDWLKIMSFLCLLSDPHKSHKLRQNNSEIPLISRDILDESELFSPCEVFSTENIVRYSDYSKVIGSDDMLTAIDSAYGGSESESEVNHFKVLDPDVFNEDPNFLDLYTGELDVRDKEMVDSLYGAVSDPFSSDGSSIAPRFGFPDVNSTLTQSQFSKTLTDDGVRPDSGLGADISAPSTAPSSPEKQETVVEKTVHHTRGIPVTCWERGRRPGGYITSELNVKPYLTQAGPQVFHIVYKHHLHCMRILRPEHTLNVIYVIELKQLMKDLFRMMFGAASKCFDFIPGTDSYRLRVGLTVEGLSYHALDSACEPLIQCGAYFLRLSKLCDSCIWTASPTLRCFIFALRNYIQLYMGNVLRLSKVAETPFQAVNVMKEHLNSISLIAKICQLSDFNTPPQYTAEYLPDGLDLVSYLYFEAKRYSGTKYLSLILYLFKCCSQPYVEFLREWVYNGECCDDNGEFFIDVNPDCLEQKDRKYWTHGYKLLQSRECLLQTSVKTKLFLAGKSLALLKIVTPGHSLLQSGLIIPQLEICFTQTELDEQIEQTNIYIKQRTQMSRAAIITRQEMLDEEALSRISLIKRAQEEQAAALSKIMKEIEARRKTEYERKKKWREELALQAKEHRQMKDTEEHEEKEKDAELVNQLMQREQLETQRDRELETQARTELIKYYELLSETAEKRERLALWKIRRHQNNLLRAEFYQKQQNYIDDELEFGYRGEITSDNQLDGTERKRWTKPDVVDIKEETDSQLQELEENEDSGTATSVTPDHVTDNSVSKDDTDVAQMSDRTKPGITGDNSHSAANVKSHNEHVSEVPDEFSLQIDQTPAVVSPAKKSSSLHPSAESVHHQQSTSHSGIRTYHQDQTTPYYTDSQEKITPNYSDPLQDIKAILSLRDSERLHSYEAIAQVKVKELYDVTTSTRQVTGKHSSNETKQKETRSTIRISRDVNEISDETDSTNDTQRKQVGPHASQQSTTDSQTIYDEKLKARGVSRITRQSSEPDHDEIRKQKFQLINKLGHVSHSSIQNKMYYMTQESQDTEDVYVWPEIQPISLEEADDYYEEIGREYSLPELRSDVLISPWLEEPQIQVSHNTEDSVLYETTPLHQLIHTSLYLLLQDQMDLAISSALSYFYSELQIDKHFTVLYNFVLMSNGEFAQQFTLPIFDKIHSYADERTVLSTLYLTNKLKSALEFCRQTDNPLTRNLFIKKNNPPKRLQPNSITAVDWIQLAYTVGWPLNIIISPDEIKIYQQIFTLQLQYHHISYLLSDIWSTLKLSKIKSTQYQGRQLTQLNTLHLIRHDMEHFVKLMHNYIVLQLQLSWQQFQQQLTKVKNIDELYQVHSAFLKQCTRRCLMSASYKKFQQIVDGILKSVVKFYAMLKTGTWSHYTYEEDDDIELDIHSEYSGIIKMFTSYTEYTKFLNKVLTKMTSNGQQPHLQELHLMLNFSQYYGPG